MSVLGDAGSPGNINQSPFMPIQTLSSEKLTKHIQRIVSTKRLSYMDAVLYLCEQRKVEPEIIAPLLGDIIKSKIAEDAERLHLMPKSPQLPF